MSSNRNNYQITVEFTAVLSICSVSKWFDQAIIALLLEVRWAAINLVATFHFCTSRINNIDFLIRFSKKVHILFNLLCKWIHKITSKIINSITVMLCLSSVHKVYISAEWSWSSVSVFSSGGPTVFFWLTAQQAYGGGFSKGLNEAP